jgi:hypothetical protein
MTRKEVVKAVREYVRKELEAKNFDLEYLNVQALNTKIKYSLESILDDTKIGLGEIETES